MKKLTMIMLMLVALAFADIKLDFHVSVNRLGCTLTQWVQDDYESGIKWKHYAKFACKDPISVPARIVGLKFLDVAQNFKGEYIYTYGED